MKNLKHETNELLKYYFIKKNNKYFNAWWRSGLIAHF